MPPSRVGELSRRCNFPRQLVFSGYLNLPMKTSSIISIVAALTAVLFAPLSFELTTSLVFVAGFACIVAGDYARSAKPWRSHLRLEGGRIPTGAQLSPLFELAA